MDELRPSRTALRVALRRAAHQIYDSKPLVFDDPFAVRILGPPDSPYREELRRTPQRADRPHSRGLRAFLVARSRFAEDQVTAGAASGATQYVLLGAGLDTFALRNPYARLRVFEVDHPATQRWKREMLRAGSFEERATSVPVDFERQDLAAELARSGFDSRARTVFAWLGVVPYLTLGAFRSTLALLARSAAGSTAVMDYGQPRAVLPPLEQLAHDSLADRVRRAGEPFQLFFTPEQMRAELGAFREVEDLGGRELNARYFEDRDDGLRLLGSSGRLLRATL